MQYSLEAHYFYQKVPGKSKFSLIRLNTLEHIQNRWLIDTDKDEEGMRVIADLHGGDPNDREAKEEFKEIKERVMTEVDIFFQSSLNWN